MHPAPPEAVSAANEQEAAQRAAARQIEQAAPGAAK
jgi:hypothetical protein